MHLPCLEDSLKEIASTTSNLQKHNSAIFVLWLTDAQKPLLRSIL